MSFQEVSSLDADVTVALGKIDKKSGKPYPKQVEGYYLGNRKVENKKGESLLHFLQTSKGNLGVWGTTDLNRKMSQVAPGTMVRITSTGTKDTPRGEMYTYKVESDKTNTIEVETQASGGGDEPVVSDDSYDADDYSSDQDNEGSFSGVATNARSKAEVEALLRGKNKGAKQ